MAFTKSYCQDKKSVKRLKLEKSKKEIFAFEQS
jgi:hypothetical protein